MDENPVVAGMLATICSAVDQNRMSLFLQPIVTLPQRKVRYYEAMTRLHNDRDEVVPAADFIAQAQAAGLMAAIDNMAMFRCVQTVRRLLLDDRDIGLFCNLSTSTLSDNRIFPGLLEFLDANRAIAPSIMLEFTQHATRQMSPLETQRLAALAERGYRFSLDHVTDLHIEMRELAARGFRFVKIPVALLFDRTKNRAAGEPCEIAEELKSFGIDLIAERIEGDDAVIDLLDQDVRFGQGFLFSPPRPVRAEVFGSGIPNVRKMP